MSRNAVQKAQGAGVSRLSCIISRPNGRRPLWGALAMMALLAFLAPACSQRQDPPVESSLTIALNFPEGYTYDRSTYALYPPSDQLNVVMPPYVTGMTLTISGEDMDTQIHNIDLSTLTVSFVISPGIRIFTITVTTNIGLTFTDSVTMEIVSGLPLGLGFNLNLNAAPVIDSASATPPVTEPGAVVALACSASDLDPEDTLVYTWTGPGGFTSSGQAASYTIGDYGSYSFTCTVSDGQGGIATATVSVSAPYPNQPPVITSITVYEAWYMTIPYYYFSQMPVIVHCAAMDPDRDLIYTVIRDGFGSVIGAGPTSGEYILPMVRGCLEPVPFNFNCEVWDKWHAPVSATKTIQMYGSNCEMPF